MIKNDLQKYTDIVKNNIEENLNTITSIVYKYDVKKVLQLDKLSTEEQDKIVERCINDCLSKIQNMSFDDRCLNRIAHDVDFIIKVKHNGTYVFPFCFRMNHRKVEDGFTNLVKLSVAA